MKNFKKIALCIIAIALICSTCLAAACVAPTADKEGKITVVIGETAYTIDLSTVKDIKNFDSVLDYLKETENVVLEYTESQYGRFYTRIGSVIPTETGEYVCLYTTVEKDFSTWEPVGTYNYKGTTLTASGLGSSSMSIVKGAIYAVEIAVENGSSSGEELGTITLLVGEEAYTIDLSKLTIEKGLQSVLDYLKTEQNLTLEYTENGGIRTYTQIGALVPDREKGEFMRLYTSVSKNAMTGENAKTIEYNGIVLSEAKVGVTALTIEKDCVIALKLDVLEGSGDESDKEGTMTLVIGETAYTVDLSEVEITAGADSILDYLKENEDVTIEYSESQYGRYYTKMGSLVPNVDNNEYISVYTTVEKDFSTWDPVGTYVYNQTTLTEAGVGASSLTIEKDCVIAFEIVSYTALEDPSTMTLVIGETAYTVDLSEVEITAGIDSILDYLEENSNLTLEYSESQYGRYYSKVGSLSPDGAKNEYISLYTTVESDFSTWEPVGTFTYNETTLTASGVGASSMTVEKDCVIALEIIIYGSMDLVIGEDVYTVDLSTIVITAGADSILDYLAATQSLTLEYTESQYGRYYSKIGSLVPNADDNEFISVYTTVEKDFSTWEPVGTFTYKETTLTAAGVGASSLTIEDGCAIAFIVETW